MVCCLWILGFVPHVSLVGIDTLTARTTLRLWHDLHVEKKLAHDFQGVFDPRQDECIYLAGVMSDEIKAIAQCQIGKDYVYDTSESLDDYAHMLAVRSIAYAPQCDPIADAFVKLLAQKSVSVDVAIRSKQPRWYIAYAFYTEPSTDHMSS